MISTRLIARGSVNGEKAKRTEEAFPAGFRGLTPTAVYEEGLKFFAGQGMLNNTLRRLAKDLEEKGIDYTVIGAVALNQHGYRRFTEDIAVLLTKEGLARFQEELIGRGYRPAFEGATRIFRTVGEGVTVEVVTAGEYPGDGRPKPVKFPVPSEATVEIDGVKTINLEKLVELKLASGTSAPDRLKDLADIQELIKVKNLPAEFAEQLDASVRGKLRELHEAVQAARQRERGMER
jgi:predicted nucleotidyltransferase